MRVNADSFKGWGIRFFFYSGDRDEPVHIHVERDDKIAKFWLDPVRLQISGGFSRLEISKIHGMIEKHHSKLMEAWHVAEVRHRGPAVRRH